MNTRTTSILTALLTVTVAASASAANWAPGWDVTTDSGVKLRESAGSVDIQAPDDGSEVYVMELDGTTYFYVDNEVAMTKTKNLSRIWFYGGDGDDQFTNTTDIEVWAYGYEGDDTLIGGDGEDRIYGGDDDDTIVGGGADDVLIGEDGNDTLVGDTGKDSLYGGDGNDACYGNDAERNPDMEADTMDGGDGIDFAAPAEEDSWIDFETMAPVGGFWFG